MNSGNNNIYGQPLPYGFQPPLNQNHFNQPPQGQYYPPPQGNYGPQQGPYQAPYQQPPQQPYNQQPHQGQYGQQPPPNQFNPPVNQQNPNSIGYGEHNERQGYYDQPSINQQNYPQGQYNQQQSPQGQYNQPPPYQPPQANLPQPEDTLISSVPLSNKRKANSQPLHPSLEPENTKRHKPNLSINPTFVELAKGRGIDQNEYNSIVGAAKKVYEESKNDNKTLSLKAGREIKNALNGEWFIFVSEKGKKYDFSLSTVANDDYLAFSLGDSMFQICRLK